jgi:hypothetical protein
MVGYPRALRTAHHVVYVHPADARDYVAGKIAEALRTGHGAEAARWRKVSHFVERLLAVQPPPERPEAAPAAALPPGTLRRRRLSQRARR